MNIKRYIEEAYKTACANGFHDEEKPIEHWLMLVITEVSEAVEADRKSKRANVAMFERESKTPQSPEHVTKHWQFCFEQFVKDTLEDELADICIRLFDLAGTFNYTFELSTSYEFNEKLIKKFKQRTFTEVAYELCTALARQKPHISTIDIAFAFVVYWAKSLDIDLKWHIEQKMKYNKLRTRMHGKKY